MQSKAPIRCRPPRRSYPFRFKPSEIFPVRCRCGYYFRTEAQAKAHREAYSNQKEQSVVVKADPINPAHYNGTACAEIGERLSANSYQVLKYNWRLGRKDDPVIEIGKSIWYLDREIVLAEKGQTWIPYDAMPNELFFTSRLAGVGEHVRAVALALLLWNQTGDIEILHHLREDLIKERATLEATSTGQETMVI